MQIGEGGRARGASFVASAFSLPSKGTVFPKFYETLDGGSDCPGSFLRILLAKSSSPPLKTEKRERRLPDIVVRGGFASRLSF